MKEASTSEAWPILGKYRNTCFVVKLGGQPLTDHNALNNLAFDISLLRHSGVHVVVVHGGGPQLSEMSDRLGLAIKKIDGRRITDADTLKLAKMVFAGVDCRRMTYAHYVEFMVGVPHAYNKLFDVPIYRNKEKINLPVCNQVRYLEHLKHSVIYDDVGNTKKFEKQFSKKLGCKYALMTNSGSSANLLALSAIINPLFKNKLRNGDEVLTVSNTAIPTVSAIRSTGANVKFVDVNENYLIDYNYPNIQNITLDLRNKS